MMSKDQKSIHSLLQNLKEKAANQKRYDENTTERAAQMYAKDCLNCGAGRAKKDGVTHCAYCGFAFIKTKITKGLHINESDNSKI